MAMSAIDRSGVGEVVQDMAHRDDRVRDWDRVVGESQPTDFLRIARGVAREVEHRR